MLKIRSFLDDSKEFQNFIMPTSSLTDAVLKFNCAKLQIFVRCLRIFDFQNKILIPLHLRLEDDVRG